MINRRILGQLDKKELKSVPIHELIPYDKNPRKNADAVDKVASSLKEFGLVKNSVICDENMVLIAGHTTVKAMQKLGWDKVPEVTQVSGLTDNQKKAYRIADNKLGEIAEWDLELLIPQLQELKLDDMLEFTGFDEDELNSMIDGFDEDPTQIETPDQAHAKLADKFIVPPFSVLDTRQGYWQERKRAWIALGIKSELGRGGAILYGSETVTDMHFYKKKCDLEQQMGSRVATSDAISVMVTNGRAP